MKRKKKKRIIHSPSRDLWRRMKKNPLGMAGIYTVSISVLIAILGYLIMPDSTPMANEMSLPLSVKKPGFSVKMLWIRKNKEVQEAGFFLKMFFGEESPFEKIPIQKYFFKGSDFVYEEYKPGSKISEEVRINLADVVYSISVENPVVTSRNDSLFFLDLNGIKHKTSIKSLRKTVENDYLHQRFFILGTDR